MQREKIDWKDRTPRRDVSHVAAAELQDGTSIRVLVTNLSYEGCQILSDSAFTVGETFRLVLAGRGSMNAQIRWTSAERSGVRFLAGLSPFDERRARLGV